jgi:hypothetical protein
VTETDACSSWYRRSLTVERKAAPELRGLRRTRKVRLHRRAAANGLFALLLGRGLYLRETLTVRFQSVRHIDSYW